MLLCVFVQVEDWLEVGMKRVMRALKEKKTCRLQQTARPCHQTARPCQNPARPCQNLHGRAKPQKPTDILARSCHFQHGRANFSTVVPSEIQFRKKPAKPTRPCQIRHGRAKPQHGRASYSTAVQRGFRIVFRVF